MKTTDFQKGVLRTCSADFEKIGERVANSSGLNFMHSLCGMSAEISELLLAQDKPNAIEELGDFLWYDALAHHAINVPFDYDPNKYVDGRHSDMHHAITMDSLDFTRHVGELHDLFKGHVFYGRRLDYDKAEELLAKVTWAAFGSCYRVGSSPEDVMRKNQEKLRARYPEKFTEENANVRDLEKERAILKEEKTKSDAEKFQAAMEEATVEAAKEKGFDPQY